MDSKATQLLFSMSDKIYNRLKAVAQYYLPALGTLYFALAGIWGLGYGEEVIGTITAIDIFLGVLLGFSTKVYNTGPSKYDGKLVVDEKDPLTETYRLEMDGPLEDLKGKRELKLKVSNPLVTPPSQE